jgi:hypothetical protein
MTWQHSMITLRVARFPGVQLFDIRREPLEPDIPQMANLHRREHHHNATNTTILPPRTNVGLD